MQKTSCSYAMYKGSCSYAMYKTSCSYALHKASYSYAVHKASCSYATNKTGCCYAMKAEAVHIAHQLQFCNLQASCTLATHKSSAITNKWLQMLWWLALTWPQNSSPTLPAMICWMKTWVLSEGPHQAGQGSAAPAFKALWPSLMALCSLPVKERCGRPSKTSICANRSG